jgi:hypothetical protein
MPIVSSFILVYLNRFQRGNPEGLHRAFLFIYAVNLARKCYKQIKLVEKLPKNSEKLRGMAKYPSSPVHKLAKTAKNGPAYENPP